MVRWNVRARSVQTGALLAAVLCAAAPAAAEVRVTDAGGGELVIEAHDASIRDILEALGKDGTISFRNSDALSRPVTGTYSGTVRRVLSRILDGYDHVIRSTSSGLQVDIVGAAQSARAATSAGPGMTAPVPRGPRVASGVTPRVSSNVDADEESTQSPPGPLTVNLASGPKPSAPPAVQPSHAGLMGSAPRPRVSSNLDADE